MKKLAAIGIPLLLAALILAGGVLLPQAAIRRQRQVYLNQMVSVPVEEVQPYGEEYEERKNQLRDGIRLMWETEGGDGYSGLDIVDADREITQRYREGLNQMRAFFDLLEEKVSWFDKNALKNYPAEVRNWIYTPGDMDNALGQIGMFNEEYGAYNLIYFDLDTGLPLYAELYLILEEEAENYAGELWEGLLAAYEEIVGISFTDQSAVLPFSSVSGSVSGQVVYDKYEEASMEAVSADGVFLLAGEYYQSGDEVFVRLSLTENSEN